MPSNFALALTIAVLPEAILVGVAGVCALLAFVRPGQRPDLYRWLACIALAGAVAASGFALFAMRNNANGVALTVWGGGLAVDRFSIFITVTVCAFAFITCLLSDTYLRSIPTRSGGFFALVLLATAATSALAAQHEMITMFIAFQLLVVCLVAIPALVKTDSRGAESSFKYLIEAGVASAMLLYGLAILYGVTGSTDLRAVSGALTRAPGPAALGIALVVLALTFALGIFPLRQWLGRVAEATHATVAGFVITIGVTAGAVAWVRVGITGFGAAVHPWTGLATAIIAIGLVYAALSAQRETRVSRLAGIIASAQAALMLLAIIGFGARSGTAPAAGTIAFLFALAVFGLAVLAVFAVLAMFQTAGLGDGREDFRGLGHRSPPSALLFAIALTTLAGAPPLAGFIARLLIVDSAFEAGYGWLVVVALMSMVAIAIPVIRLIGLMYAEGGDEVPFTVTATPRLGRVTAAVCCLGGLYLAFLVQPLLMLARAGAGPLR
jgi:NADH-quinone oxidoreductase subunit N